ncbi:MAG: DUF3109 family protein [Rhodothermales bacterium]|nr:DUF3109 family protein [Rhodothermales bacterium]
MGNILISDDVVDAPFACNLGACHGACCVHGDSGAPLEEDELPLIEHALKVVGHTLRPEAREVIARKGPWEETSPGYYATTCVGDAECVFVTYDGPVAKCAIQKAQQEGRLEFAKPISCHLYPIRIEDLGDYEALNYERVDICKPAVPHGKRTGTRLPNFLRDPLVRRYGEDWYDLFIDACEERSRILNGQ